MKKINTFESYQAEKQDRREQLIRDYLGFLTESKVSFKHVTGLAVMVSKHVAKHDKSGKCDKSTLLRNPRYKSLLISHIVDSRVGTKRLAQRGIKDDAARAAVATAQLQAANLRREVARLKAYVESLEKTAVALPASHSEPSKELERVKADLHLGGIKFARTCQTLYKVLKQMDRVLLLDPEQRRILDLSKTRNNVVVGADLADPFFDWLAEIRQLSAGKRS